MFKGVLPGANYTTNYPAFFNASTLAATVSMNCFQGELQGACMAAVHQSPVLAGTVWQQSTCCIIGWCERF